jgi:hypothetical protein
MKILSAGRRYYTGNLVNGLVHLGVDHLVGSQEAPSGDFFTPFVDPASDMLLGISATVEPFLLDLSRGWQQEDHHGVGAGRQDLLRPLYVNFQQHVAARWRTGHRRAVEVAQEFRPLEEPARGDVATETLLCDEYVCVLGLAAAAWPRRP